MDRSLRLPRAFISRWPFPGRYLAADWLGRLAATRSPAIMGKIQEYEVEFDLRDELQRQMYFGLFNPQLVRVLKATLGPRDVFYDVGANVGYFTLIASQLVGMNGQVHAFEPVPANLARIKSNLDRNEITNVSLNLCAVSNAPGELTLYLAKEPSNSGWASVVPSERRPDKLTVETLSLDDYVFGSGRRIPALIKMDIEGAEPMALAGMTRLMAHDHAPNLIVEINPYLLAREGLTAKAITDPLLDAGYRVGRIERSRITRISPNHRFVQLTDILASKRGLAELVSDS